MLFFPVPPCLRSLERFNTGGEICICDNNTLICNNETIPDCYCPVGYYYGPDGECLPKSLCTSCPSGASHQSQGEVCICDDAAGLICTNSSVNQCYCSSGYYLNPDGQCVLQSTCTVTPSCDISNQTYQPVGEDCICGKTSNIICAPVLTPGCYCPPDYYQDPTGACVLKSTCTGIICNDPQAYQQSGENCICDGTAGLICNNQTIPQCYCPPNYYKGPMGDCLKKSDCSNNPVCSGDEQYLDVGEDCICGVTQNIICVPVQIPACYCPPDYYRDSQGLCVLKSDCTGIICQSPTIYQNEGENCICSNTGLVCVNQTISGCYCPPDFYKDPNGVCISKETCQPTVECTIAMQVFQPMGYNCICDVNFNFICEPVNIPGCYCPDGYYLDTTGTCVLNSTCTSTGPCIIPETLQDQGENCICDLKAGLICANQTVSGCYCPPDYFKNSTGDCQLKSDCVPTCAAPTIYQQIGEDCICDTNQQLLCNPVAVPGCYCPSGYYEGTNGVCVEKTTCPGSSCSAPEVYQQTGEKCICTSVNGLVCASTTIAGCYCPPDQFKDSTGNCVPKSSCPACMFFKFCYNISILI